MKFLITLTLLCSVSALASQTELVRCQIDAKPVNGIMSPSQTKSPFLLASGFKRNLTYYQAGIGRSFEQVGQPGVPAPYEIFLSRLTVKNGQVSAQIRGEKTTTITSGLKFVFSNSLVSGQVTCQKDDSPYFFVSDDGRVFNETIALDNGYGAPLYVDDALEQAGKCVGGSISAAAQAILADNSFEGTNLEFSEGQSMSWTRATCLGRFQDPSGEGRGSCNEWALSQPSGEGREGNDHVIAACAK